nr:MAG TPA: FAM222A family protein [Caudoviricetes sp.]
MTWKYFTAFYKESQQILPLKIKMFPNMVDFYRQREYITRVITVNGKER